MAKIMIITPFPPDGIGGAETFVKALIKETQKENEVTLCTLKPRKKAWKGTGVKNLISCLPLLTIKALCTTIRSKPNIIHAQGLISGLVAVLLKKIFKVKVFITLLALYEFHKRGFVFRKISWFILINCDLIFVEGYAGARDLFGYCLQDKLRLFNHWVDQDVFKPPQERPNDKIRVLFVGRPIPEKGKHIVEEAERIINDKEKYEFIYVENCPHDELVKYYQMAHILIVPSLYAEGYVRVIAEAASCGCAIITSDRGSLPEQIKDFGMVVPMTGKHLASAIKRIFLNDYQHFAYMYAKYNFSPKNAEVFLNEYKVA